jgi:hypothetical protein
MNLIDCLDIVYSLEDAPFDIRDRDILDEYLKFRIEYTQKESPIFDIEWFKIEALWYLLNIEANYFGYAYTPRNKPVGILIGRIPNFNDHQNHIEDVRKYSDYLYEKMKASDDYTGYHFLSVDRGRTKKEPFSVTVKRRPVFRLKNARGSPSLKRLKNIKAKVMAKNLSLIL